MAKYIYKYQFENITLHVQPDLWKKLIPKDVAIRLDWYNPEGTNIIVKRWNAYHIEENPFYKLQMAEDLMNCGYISTLQFEAIKKKAVCEYWRWWTNTREWIDWYNRYEYNEEKEKARSRFGEEFVNEYIAEQKSALAEGCSSLVFKNGTQIPEELENKIMDYV